jgi:hypothetical protein
MMAATPAIMPTRVRKDRSLWDPIAETAILKDSKRVMVCPVSVSVSVPVPEILPRHLRGRFARSQPGS